MTNSKIELPTSSPIVVSESVNYLDVGLKLEVEPQVFLEDDVGIKIGPGETRAGHRVAVAHSAVQSSGCLERQTPGDGGEHGSGKRRLPFGEAPKSEFLVHFAVPLSGVGGFLAILQNGRRQGLYRRFTVYLCRFKSHLR